MSQTVLLMVWELAGILIVACVVSGACFYQLGRRAAFQHVLNVCQVHDQYQEAEPVGTAAQKGPAPASDMDRIRAAGREGQS